MRQIGTLPGPLTHAAGASLNGALYIIGGRSSSLTGQTRDVLAVDPRTGKVSSAGRLPYALSDAAAVTAGQRILVLGGRDAGGQVHDGILALGPVP